MRLSLCSSLSLESLSLFSFLWDARQEAAPIWFSLALLCQSRRMKSL